MNIDSRQLGRLMIAVANERFGPRSFSRRDLLKATEQELRKRGHWTAADEEPSSSVDPKSKGLANIDYRFSDLSRGGDLVSHRRNVWRIAEARRIT